MSYLSNSGYPTSISRRCLTLLGTFAFALCFQTMFAIPGQAQDHDRVVRRGGVQMKALSHTKDRSRNVSNALAAGAPAVTVTVTPANTQGWAPSDTRPGGAVNYVYDPAAPAGFGALQLTTDATDAAKADYFHSGGGVLLSSVTELAYQTKQNSGPPTAAATYQIPVFLNGTTGFATIVYEPYWNGTVTSGNWQQWDVDAGMFWTSNGTPITCTATGTTITGVRGGPPNYTLAQLKTACPDAVVLGYGVNIGTFNPNYNVETDLFDFNGTVYNFEPNASTIVVDDDGMASAGDCNAATPASTTIQGAVTAANPGDTIKVCPGTYAEQVVIDKTLTLNGPQANVDARTATRGTTPAGEAIVTGTGNGGLTPVYVTANNVTVNGFTIEGNTSGSNFGFGILLAPATSGTNVLNNIIQNNIIGLGLANNSATNQTRIEQNLFRNNNQPGPASGFGIYTEEAMTGGLVTNVVINENAFTSNDNGAVGLVAVAPGSQTNITVSNNDFTGNGNAINVSSSTNLTITGNNITTSQFTQVFIDGSTGLNFTCNTVRDGASRGIRFSDFGSGGSSGSTVNNNNFVRNALGAIVEEAGGHTNPLNAQNNYYGSPTGPTIGTNPGGTGDAIFDADGVVVYQPFLTTPSTCAPALPRDCSTVTSPYNVVTEFSLGSNPNCEFSYGWTASPSVDSPFTLYNFATPDVPVAGIDRWHRDSPDSDLVPAVFHNRNGTTTTYATVQQPADELNVHPGQAGERSVVRFTAPVAGRYTLVGRFEGIDTNGTTSDVSIVSRPANNAPSTPVFADTVNGFGDIKRFFVTVNLLAGEMVDFSVGYGANQTYGADSTGLAAVITLNGPTAAGVSVSGRVLSSEGRAVRGATVTMTDTNGVSRSAASGPQGAFTFDDVAAGRSYTFTVSSRRFAFDPIVISVSDNVSDIVFTPSAGGSRDR
jgi:hypothetical protein